MNSAKDYVVQDFKETIERASRSGFLDEKARLIFSGRLEYASERGDITLNQLDQLLELLQPDFYSHYRREMQIATEGEPEPVLATS